MRLVEISPNSFTETRQQIDEVFDTSGLKTPRESIAVYGGATRSALIEVTTGRSLVVRDLDLVTVGEEYLGADYLALFKKLYPGENYDFVQGDHYESPRDVLTARVDYTINQSAIVLGQNPRLVTSTKALEDATDRIVSPTIERVKDTHLLGQSHNPLEQTRYHKILSEMPARGSYLTAVLRASGLNFDLSMEDQPRVTNPTETYEFYLGLMARKSLEVDELERGPGDISATSIMIELFRELNLTNKRVRTTGDIVRFCHDIQADFPSLDFSDTSEIGDMIESTR